MSDQDWLSRVAHLLTPELQQEYLRRVRIARYNAKRHAWRGSAVREGAEA